MPENVTHIDIYEHSDYEVAAALEQAAEAREPITVATCNNTVTTYRAVPLSEANVGGSQP